MATNVVEVEDDDAYISKLFSDEKLCSLKELDADFLRGHDDSDLGLLVTVERAKSRCLWSCTFK